MVADSGKSNVYLKWSEPATVRRWEWAAAVKRERFVIFLASLVMLLILRAISTNPSSPKWPLSILIAFVGASSFGIFMPWFVSIFPSQILVSTKGINRNAPRMWGRSGIFSIDFWKWDDMDQCMIATTALGNRTFRTLTLFNADIQRAMIGLGGKISEAELIVVLERHGVRVRQDSI